MSNTDIEARKGVRMLKGKKKSILYSLPVRKAADEQPQLRDKKPSTAQSQGKNVWKRILLFLSKCWAKELDPEAVNAHMATFITERKSQKTGWSSKPGQPLTAVRPLPKATDALSWVTPLNDAAHARQSHICGTRLLLSPPPRSSFPTSISPLLSQTNRSGETSVKPCCKFAKYKKLPTLVPFSRLPFASHIL